MARVAVGRLAAVPTFHATANSTRKRASTTPAATRDRERGPRVPCQNKLSSCMRYYRDAMISGDVALAQTAMGPHPWAERHKVGRLEEVAEGEQRSPPECASAAMEGNRAVDEGIARWGEVISHGTALTALTVARETLPNPCWAGLGLELVEVASRHPEPVLLLVRSLVPGSSAERCGSITPGTYIHMYSINMYIYIDIFTYVCRRQSHCCGSEAGENLWGGEEFDDGRARDIGHAIIGAAWPRV